MAENSAIGWTDHTWNPWIGCQEVSPACDNCYARVQNNHRHWVDGWGPHGERKRTSDTNWCKPLSWDRKAKKLGIRYTVFSGSLCDIFDNRVPALWHSDFWMQVRCTPNLDWLLLTKRPQNIPGQLPEDWGDKGYPNVWLGTTVESPKEIRRVWDILQVPAPIHFLSCEPLLGDVTKAMSQVWKPGDTPHLNWIIGGGESGPTRRELDLDHANRLKDYCLDSGIAFFFKQDSHLRAGQRGRASDALWACKQFPVMDSAPSQLFAPM